MGGVVKGLAFLHSLEFLSNCFKSTLIHSAAATAVTEMFTRWEESPEPGASNVLMHIQTLCR